MLTTRALSRSDNRVAKMLQKEILSNDQALYMLYYMVYFNKSYDDAINELLSSRDFEIYVSSRDRRKKINETID